MSLVTSKFFETADRALGDVVAPSDFIIVIDKYPHLTFNASTHGLPMLKNDTQEYSTAHGQKMEAVSNVQTLNNLPISFMERSGALPNKTTIEALIASGADDLTVTFFVGKDLESASIWGIMTDCHFKNEDSPEADSEATTSAFKFTVNISGHYSPSVVATGINVLNALL